MDDTNMIEVWRANRIECLHRGHAVICDTSGQITAQWGDPTTVIYPRSSSKMIQALPLIESGAARAHGLTSAQLALSCASHIAAPYHIDPVRAWLSDLGLDDTAFRCGPQEPTDITLRDQLIRDGQQPCRIHNNCSGKHCGFLTLTKHLGAGPDYVDPAHPVQQAAFMAFDDVTDETSPGYGIDGCSAPNPACTLTGLARAMASFAGAGQRSGTRAKAQVQLTQAMMQHPELISGHGTPCTDLMRAANGQAAIKTGADGVYAAILPGLGLGIALKITDGAKRGSAPAMAALLHHLGVIPTGHPALARHMTPQITNFAGLTTGHIAISPGFAGTPL